MVQPIQLGVRCHVCADGSSRPLYKQVVSFDPEKATYASLFTHVISKCGVCGSKNISLEIFPLTVTVDPDVRVTLKDDGALRVEVLRPGLVVESLNYDAVGDAEPEDLTCDREGVAVVRRFVTMDSSFRSRDFNHRE